MAVTIKTITVERGYTINLGNFESVKVGGNVTGEVTDGDPEAAYLELTEFLESRLMEDMDAYGNESN